MVNSEIDFTLYKLNGQIKSGMSEGNKHFSVCLVIIRSLSVTTARALGTIIP